MYFENNQKYYLNQIITIQVFFLLFFQKFYRGYLIRKIINQSKFEFIEISKQIDKNNIPNFIGLKYQFKNELINQNVHNIEIKNNNNNINKDELWNEIIVLYKKLKNEIDRKKINYQILYLIIKFKF